MQSTGLIVAELIQDKRKSSTMRRAPATAVSSRRKPAECHPRRRPHSARTALVGLTPFLVQIWPVRPVVLFSGSFMRPACDECCRMGKNLNSKQPPTKHALLTNQSHDDFFFVVVSETPAGGRPCLKSINQISYVHVEEMRAGSR